MGLNIVSTVDNTQTVDAQSLSCASFTIPQRSAALVTITCVGLDTVSGDSVCIRQSAAIKRGMSSCEFVDASQNDFSQADTSLVAATVHLAVNGSAINTNITGVSGSTINWGVEAKAYRLT